MTVPYSPAAKGVAEQGGDAWIVNAGAGSNTTEHGRRRFQSDVLAHKPALVIIQFGINDAAVLIVDHEVVISTPARLRI